MDNNKINLMMEIIALPIVSRDFLSKDLYKYVENDGRQEYDISRIYINLRNNIHIESFDEIVLYVTKYFGKYHSEDKYYKYFKFYSELSTFFLSHRDSKICFKYWLDKQTDFLGPYSGINKILLWNNLNKKINVDSIVCSYLLYKGFTDERNLHNYTNHILLQDMHLDNVLKRGFAENHFHFSAGTSFYVAWKIIMNLKCKESHIKLINSFGVLNDFKYSDIYGYSKIIAILRLLITLYLKHYKIANEKEAFNMKEYLFILEEKLKITGEFKLKEQYNNILGFINNYNAEQLPEISYIYELYRCFLNQENIYQLNEDYVELLIKNFEYDTIPENILIFKSLAYFHLKNNDYLFYKMFHTYIIFKNYIYRCMVEDYRVKGLDYFKGIFKNSTKITPNNRCEIRLKNQLSDSNLKKLEIRMSFSGKSDKEIKKQLIKSIKIILEEYKKILENGNVCQRIGIVFHFIKQKDNTKKCWFKYFNEKNDDEYLYYGKSRYLYMKQIKILKELLEEIEELKYFIVGIDTASNENDTEPWVFTPIYDYARDSNNRLLGKNFEKLKSLGYTYHVGEDFRHLLTGVRHIDEVVNEFNYLSGDRIGHAIALGVDVDQWSKNHPVVVLPAIEHLENLLWVWQIFFDNRTNISYGFLEKEITDLAKKIYGDITGVTVYSLWCAYKRKFKSFKNLSKIKYYVKENAVDKVDCKNVSGIFCRNVSERYCNEWNEEKLFLTYHCQHYLQKMNKPLTVAVSKTHIEIMRQVQIIVNNKLSEKGIVVETNPSSNAVIGEVDNLLNHHITKLNTKYSKSEYDERKNLIVTINSDDPSVFNTCVADEFSYVYYSLVEKGYEKSEILHWIDQIREYGMNCSFIDDELSKNEIIEILDCLMKKLKNR